MVFISMCEFQKTILLTQVSSPSKAKASGVWKCFAQRLRISRYPKTRLMLQSSELVNIIKYFSGTPSRPSAKAYSPDFWCLGILMCFSSSACQKRLQNSFWCLSQDWWDGVNCCFPRADPVLSFNSPFEKVFETRWAPWGSLPTDRYPRGLASEDTPSSGPKIRT